MHSAVKRSDAFAKLFNCQTASPDRETIRCTLAIVCCESLLIRRFSRWNAKILHSMSMLSDAVTVADVKKTASDLERLNALTIVCFSEDWRLNNYLLTSAKWCWLRQNVMSKRLHSILNDQMHWRGYLWCQMTVLNIDASNALAKLLIVRLLHSIMKRSNARWQLFIAKIRCSQLTATSFAMKCQRFCTQYWKRWMH